MIHYHGGPITPDTCAIRAYKGRHAFVAFSDYRQVGLVAEICQSFAFDNGEYPAWKAGTTIDRPAYYRWVAKWRRHPGFDFAVIPDRIGGSVSENDALLEEWPFARHEGLAVWHTNEPVDRLVRLANEWPRVGIGSSGEYDISKPSAYLARVRPAISAICDADGFPITKLHGLRCLNPQIFTLLPLSSGDSTMVARNIGIDKAWRGTYQPRSKETRATILVERIEDFNSVGALMGDNGGPPPDGFDELFG